MARLTITKAAKQWGIPRSTLVNHLVTKNISTSRDVNGARTIDSSEMVRVYGHGNSDEMVSLVTNNNNREIELLEGQIKLLKDRVGDLKTMLDHKEDVIKNQREMLTPLLLERLPKKGDER